MRDGVLLFPFLRRHWRFSFCPHTNVNADKVMGLSKRLGPNGATRMSLLALFLIASLETTRGHVVDHVNVDTVSEVGNSTIDWRKKGVISEVSNQGALYNSWTYAARECVESSEAIQTQKLVVLSTDELQDCCSTTCGTEQNNRGFECIISLGGICSQSHYLNNTGTCQKGSCNETAKVSQSTQLTPHREDLMAQKLHDCPLLVYIDGSLSSFAAYQEGIYDDPACSTQSANLAVQLIGYGTSNGLDYWIIKNSWGPHWGMSGYMYISRGNNSCGISNYVYFPGTS